MNLVFAPLKHLTRSVSAGLCLVAAIAISGCAGRSDALQVAPEGLDFDYAVRSNGGLGVVHAFGDQGKTILVLDQPLPANPQSVPVELPGGIRAAADVRGNYIFVPGRPDRFSVLLPSGAVEVARSSALAVAGPGSDDAPVGSSSAAAGEEGEGDEVESNLEWGTAEVQSGSGAPALHQGGPVPARPGGYNDLRQGPLPTSVEQLR